MRRKLTAGFLIATTMFGFVYGPDKYVDGMRQKIQGTIAIDAGHGGHDAGGPGLDGYNEIDFVHPISKVVGTKLEMHGYTVVYTSKKETLVGIDDRVRIARKAGCKEFVSIHTNSFGEKPSANGQEAFIKNGGPGDTRLANSIRAAVAELGYFTDRGTKNEPRKYGIIRQYDDFATIYEIGFITNRSDFNYIKNNQFEIGTKIAEGIMNTHGTDYKHGKKFVATEKTEVDLNSMTKKAQAKAKETSEKVKEESSEIAEKIQAEIEEARRQAEIQEAQEAAAKDAAELAAKREEEEKQRQEAIEAVKNEIKIEENDIRGLE